MSTLRHRDSPPGETRRRLTPALTVLAAALLMCLPLPLAWGVMPNFALLFVIIWASLQPRLMPAWVAFALGLLLDMLAGLPIGLSALVFALAVVAVRLAEARVEGHSLAVDWAFAALVILAAHLLTWQLHALVGRTVPLGPLLAQAALTALAFPPATALAARIQRRLVAGGEP
ncbi:MAG: rod shape-determining protein MreD [Sphingomonadaceae bacterium]